MPNTSKASPATDSRRNTQCNDVTHNARREERLRLWAFSRTQKLGNGQRPCWVHELTSLSIRALRVFHSKNSVVILYTAILGGDVATCRPTFIESNNRIPPSQFTIIKYANILN